MMMKMKDTCNRGTDPHTHMQIMRSHHDGVRETMNSTKHKEEEEELMTLQRQDFGMALYVCVDFVIDDVLRPDVAKLSGIRL